MEWDLFESLSQVLEEEADPDEITFSGGEPLLHPDIVRMVSRVATVGKHRTLVTNGTLLTPHLIRDLKTAGLDRIRLGIDSLRPNKPRPSKGFLVKGLDIPAIIDAALDEGLEVDLNTVVTRFNARELGSIADLAISKGISLKLFEHVVVGRLGGDDGDGEFSARPQVEYEEVLAKLADQIRGREFAPTPEFGEANLSVQVGNTEIRYCRYLCPFGGCWLTGTRVDAEGYVYTCMTRRGAVRAERPWSSRSLREAILSAREEAGCLR